MTSKPLLEESVQGAVVEAVIALGAKLAAWRSDEKMRQYVNREQHKLAADYAADAFLRETLRKLTPDIPIVSEEDADHFSARASLYWLLDPIDGTASWRGGFPGFVTQLALVADGEPRFGVVRAPILDKTFVADTDGRAFLNGARLPARQPAERIVVTDNTPEPHGICVPVMRSLGTNGYHESGSLGLKMCLVADGTADLFVKDVVVRDWDVAPALAVLRSVGALLTQANGSPFLLAGAYDKPGGLLVARDRTLWERAGRAIAGAKGWRFQE
jgi:3'(2'), 5'-bisphosphate nucleotidase